MSTVWMFAMLIDVDGVVCGGVCLKDAGHTVNGSTVNGRRASCSVHRRVMLPHVDLIPPSSLNAVA